MLDASGLIHVTGDLFLVAEDHHDTLRFFRLDGTDPSRPVFVNTGQGLCLANGRKGNSDFESLARLGDHFYVIGGFNKRERDRLLRFRLDGWALAGPPESIPLDPTPFFRRRHRDVEALSSLEDGRLLVGFRDPLDGRGRAQALIVDAGSGALAPDALLRFDLEQRGFRDWVRLDAGHDLILAGPRRSGKGKGKPSSARRLYVWTRGSAEGEIRPVRCPIELGSFRAEGLCVRHRPEGLEVLIGSDESKPARKLSGHEAAAFRLLHLTVAGVADLTGRDPLVPTEVEVQLTP